jgi:hypothetical protein
VPRPTIGDAIGDLESFVAAHVHAVEVASDAGSTREQSLAALAASTVVLARFLTALAAGLKATTAAPVAATPGPATAARPGTSPGSAASREGD